MFLIEDDKEPFDLDIDEENDIVNVISVCKHVVHFLIYRTTQGSKSHR